MQHSYRGLLQLCLLSFILHASPAFAAQPPASPDAPDAPAIQLNGVATLAAKAGIQQCLPRINQVSGFVVGDKPSGVFLFLPPEARDARASSYSLEIEATDEITSYASVTVAPTASGECNALYETVVYWPRSCLEVAMNDFSGMKSRGPLRKGIQVLEGDQSMRVFLMEAGPGCVSIKKETVY